ncbi:hypothetical protein SAMN05216337_1007131 [Bradyrhizobium brasilense]|uniref:Uncharacterized protein n=1 Tax=Bradyrhizobium brasilense TaxID=1419277 RepID=A0A1G6RWF8_9BRAD|nr:hypothetical protein [Bradyrhizobium brasilense]SDD08266.1 hypothetical protein SAMN05216337_1007131 [Bradyrhizobium brasilense]
MPAAPTNRWVKFLRNYGPIPTNDNMYDETIQRALGRLKIEPLVLPAQFLDAILDNFRSEDPQTEILTGTAGDGKTYHCREVWTALGGPGTEWNRGAKIQSLVVGSREFIVIKDLSELKAEESASILEQMAADVTDPKPSRIYLIAANHGQLLEKLKLAPQTEALKAVTKAIENLLVAGTNPDPSVRLNLRDLSQAPASEMIGLIVEKMMSHPGWSECDSCPLRDDKNACPIMENRRRLQDELDGAIFRKRLTALVDLSEQNGVHFPVRQSLALVTNILLGHPKATDGLMSCGEVAGLEEQGTLHLASIYRNVFGENLSARRAEKTDLFRKLNSFGIGSETSNRVDDLLVYGADDPDLRDTYQKLVLVDPIYGGTPAYTRAQRAYLEEADEAAREVFLPMLRSQRQRLFFTLPENNESEFELWDLTVFRYGGTYLDLIQKLKAREAVPRGVMSMIVRGLNRVFTGMLVQNQDEMVLATSGSHSQSKTSPLLDEMISVPRQQGEEVSLVPWERGGVALRVRVSRGDVPGPIVLQLTPTRFEFLGRVAEGSLPSSFSLECHEDLLAFKAKLLSATERRRAIDEDDAPEDGELMLRFVELQNDGRAGQRRVLVRI